MSLQITKKPLLPKITIKKNDASLYTFDFFSSTFDFRLRGLQFEPPKDAVGGKFNMQITSSDGSNSGMNTILTNITGGNEVTIWVGKSTATLTKLFLGIIEEIEITEPNKNFMDVKISGPDWGSALLKNRVVVGEWIQDYVAGTTNLDAADTDVLISQIVTDLLTKTQYYPDGDTPITAEQQGLVVLAANITPINIPLAQFTASYEKLDDKLTDLDKVGLSAHFVDADKNFIMKQDTTVNFSNILLTDDYNDATAIAWPDQTKVGLIGLNTTVNESLETHKRRFFGLGGDQTDQKDQTQETDTTSSTLHDNYLAQRFTPKFNNVYDIAVKLSKTGTPTLDLTLELIEDDGANLPKGTVLRAVDLSKSAVTTTAAFHLFKMSEKLNTAKNYWIVIRRISTDNASNHFKWHRNAGTSHVNAFSTDGTTWTVQSASYGFTFIQYYSTPLMTVKKTVGLSSSSKHIYEEAIKEPDITKKQLLDALIDKEASYAFKKKTIFHGMIYAPDSLIKNGDKIRIRKQASGYTFDNDDFIVGSVSYIFQSSDDLATGTFWYEITASRFSDYA